MNAFCSRRSVLVILLSLFWPALALAQSSLALSSCEPQSAAKLPPACSAVRGERAEGWLSQSRSEIMARNGMVSTSQPLAAQAGLQILRAGGNAVDAAVAAAAVLNVVEPHSAGIGGDLFAIVYLAREHKLIGINASGWAPTGATVDHLKSQGFNATTGMPDFGILTVDVPGAVEGWDQLLKRAGTMDFRKVLQPAEELAEQGFPWSQRIARDMADYLYLQHPDQGRSRYPPDLLSAWHHAGSRRPVPQPGSRARIPRVAAAGTRCLLQGCDRAGYHRQIERARRHHDRGGSRGLSRRVGHTAHHQLSRLRCLRTAAERAGLRSARGTEYSRGLRAEAGFRSGEAGAHFAGVLAPAGGDQEARLRRPESLQRRSPLCIHRDRQADLETVRLDAVPAHRS